MALEGVVVPRAVLVVLAALFVVQTTTANVDTFAVADVVFLKPLTLIVRGTAFGVIVPFARTWCTWWMTLLGVGLPFALQFVTGLFVVQIFADFFGSKALRYTLDRSRQPQASLIVLARYVTQELLTSQVFLSFLMACCVCLIILTAVVRTVVLCQNLGAGEFVIILFTQATLVEPSAILAFLAPMVVIDACAGHRRLALSDAVRLGVKPLAAVGKCTQLVTLELVAFWIGSRWCYTKDHGTKHRPHEWRHRELSVQLYSTFCRNLLLTVTVSEVWNLGWLPELL